MQTGDIVTVKHYSFDGGEITIKQSRVEILKTTRLNAVVKYIDGPKAGSKRMISKRRLNQN